MIKLGLRIYSHHRSNVSSQYDYLDLKIKCISWNDNACAISVFVEDGGRDRNAIDKPYVQLVTPSQSHIKIY